MPRRRSFVLAVIPLVALLVLPAVASAGSRFWVKDRRGNVIGSVRGVAVFDNGGARVGLLKRDASDPSRMWVVRLSAPRGAKAQVIAIAGAGKVRRYPGAAVIGSYAKSGGHWVVLRHNAGSDHVRGTVAGGCPARVAAGAVRLLCWTTTAPTYRVTTEPQAGYQAVYTFIAAAKKTLDMTMYSLVDPKATAALIADAARGVRVRVLLDSTTATGNKAANQPTFNELKAHGVKVRWAWSGVLWHQKTMVRDGRVVAVMTCNLTAAYYPVIRGWIVVTDDRATAAGAQATFNADFARTDGPPTAGVVPKGSQLIWSPGAQDRLVKLIGTARPGTTLYAEDEQLQSVPIEQALVAAARKGVTVDLTMTASDAYLGAFDTLSAGGVHVSLYAPSYRLYIQSKAISVNDHTVYVGSMNFTTAMLTADRNMGLVTTEPGVVRGIVATMASDFAGATPYTGK
jgi:cardiolipin synthase